MAMWDKRFLKIAEEVAQWSKDPSTKVGAVAVGSKKQILAQGYNGFPRGIADTSERLNLREEKYKRIVHAEMNVIYNATYSGVSLNGATLYVTGLPVCSECSKGIIQVGIKRVVMPETFIDGKWLDSWLLSRSLFLEAGVQFDFISMDEAI